jgi:tetratricopeptide (TPR) repeat protein
MGNIEQAVLDVEEAVRQDQDDWELWAWRGLILLEAGRLEEAIADLTRVIDSGLCEKYASELYLARARARYMLGDPVGAEEDCTICIDEDFHEQAHWPFVVPSRSRGVHATYVVRAEARLATGALTLALGDSFFAVLLAPDDPVNYELRARVYYAIGNLQQAMLDTARAAHLSRQSGDDDLRVIAEAEAIRFAGAH